jgi:hypothetical protein
MSSGFTKTFRLIALVLLLSVMQVYVLAHPASTSTTSATSNSAAVNRPVVTEHQLNFIKQHQVTSQSQLASERAITFAPKSPLSLAFTKTGVEKSASRTAFLKIRKGTYDLMMSPKGQSGSGTNDQSSDDNGNDRKALYITAAIVIGAAVAALLVFNHDNDNNGIRGQ